MYAYGYGYDGMIVSFSTFKLALYGYLSERKKSTRDNEHSVFP